MKRELPFFSFGNEAVGVIAIGNVARGVIAIGGSASIGVIAIGMNAVGVIAIGLNAAGPLALGLINACGILVLAGVNAIGGAGHGFVNSGIHPALGMALLAAGIAVGQTIQRPRSRREIDPGVTRSLAELVTSEPGVHVVLASTRVDGGLAILRDGDHTLSAELDVGVITTRRRSPCMVEVVDRFDESDYRSTEKRRRHRLLGIAPSRTGAMFPTRDDLAWLLGRTLQLGSFAAAFVVLLLSI